MRLRAVKPIGLDKEAFGSVNCSDALEPACLHMYCCVAFAHRRAVACASSLTAHRGIAGRTSLQPRARAPSQRTGIVPACGHRPSARGHRPNCAGRTARHGYSLELRLVPLAVPPGAVDESVPFPFEGCRCRSTPLRGLQSLFL